jgi:DNA-binding response OmpR family regulator
MIALEAAPQRRPAARMTAKDILVVDDEVEIAGFVAEALRDEGYQVFVCHDGGSALEVIMRSPPGLVLLDIALPVMVGDALCAHLRRHGLSDLPVVIMTAGLHPQRYRSAGATDVLPKPFSLEALMDAVSRHLPTRR